MSIPVVAFFNNKGGVGKTSLVYHVAWMFSERGQRVLAADLDPQANLTSAFLTEDQLEPLLFDTKPADTIFACIQPLKRGVGDIVAPRLFEASARLALIPGDMALSTLEDDLSDMWPKCLDRDERAFRVTSALWRVLQSGAKSYGAIVILIDLGPNLGAINRAALIAADFVVIPLGPDLFSLQGLRNLGPGLRRWRAEWDERRSRNPSTELELPLGQMQPVGYVVLRHSIRLDRPVRAFDRWMDRMPGTYLSEVLGQSDAEAPPILNDPNCIARLRDYRSLMPLAQEARRPMFMLRPVDGAMGAHANAARRAYDDFMALAAEIGRRVGVALP